MADNLTPKEEFLLNPVEEHNITDAAIASFETNFKHPVKVTVPITPKQEGEGDPSPDNVRPISGWTGCEIHDDGKNLITSYANTITRHGVTYTKQADDTYLCNGTANNNFSWIWCVENSVFNTLGLAPGKSYTLTGCPAGGSDAKYFLTLEDTASTHVVTDYGEGVTFTYNGETNLRISFAVTRGINVTGLIVKPRLYEVEPQTLPITFTDPATGDPMTVYGGTLTLNEDGSADLVKTHVYRTIRTVTYGSLRNNLIRAFVQFSDNTGYGTTYLMCDRLKPFTNGTHNTGEYAIRYDNDFAAVCFYIVLTQNASEEGVDTSSKAVAYVNNWLADNPVNICYNLMQTRQTTYHFPNVGQLKAFLGTNNIWSDIGNVNVKYLTQNSATGLEYRGDRALELRRRAMIGDAPTIHTTIGSEETGGLASFRSYIKAPVKKIEIPFGPKQDLHGYDHPWPAGGGANLFPYDTYTAQIFNEPVSRDTYPEIWDMAEKLEPGSSYRTNCDGYTSFNINIFYSDGSHCYIAKTYQNDSIKDLSDGTITIDDIRIQIGNSSDTNPRTATNCCLEKGTTTPTYSPYENICPIEGRDGCETEHVGKNLVPDFNVTYEFWKKGWLDQDGVVKVSSAPYITSSFIKIKPNVTYTFQTNYYGTSWKASMFYDSNKQLISGTYKTGNGAIINLAPNNAQYIRVSAQSNRNGTTYLPTLLQLEIGNTSTEHESHKSSIIPLTFNQTGDHSFLPIQEGTGDPSPENVRPFHPGLTFTRDDDSVLSIYGGTLTVNSDGTGSLVSELTMPRNVGAPYIYGDNLCFGFDGTDMVNSSDPTGIKFVTEFMKYTGDYHTGLSVNLRNGFCFISSSGLNRLGLPEMAIGGELNPYWSNWYSSFVDPPKVVASLETPITYTLSVTETNRALEALGLTQHIGPIYGGTVTINPDGSADVVSEYAKNTFRTAWRYPYRASYSALLYPSPEMKSGNNIPGLSSYLSKSKLLDTKRTIRFGWNDSKIYLWGIGYIVADHLGINVTEVTEEQAYAYLAENPLEVVYPLATPITYHFSNLEQLKVWLGENNFWCDISDDITVKYWNRG